MGDVPLEVVAGEAEMPRLLGHVDLHDAQEKRVKITTAAERGALDVVDRVLAAQDEEEEQLGEDPREADHGPRQEPIEPAESRDVEARPVD